jgi:hypothetical protein
MNFKTEVDLYAAEQALREIYMICGHADPADGEGTSPSEVVAAVKAALSWVHPVPAVKVGLQLPESVPNNGTATISASFFGKGQVQRTTEGPLTKEAVAELVKAIEEHAELEIKFRHIFDL